MKKLLHEPLLHFLVIGGVLFGLYSLPVNQAVPGTSNRIHITAGDIEQMRAIFTRQWHRPATEEDLKELIAARVQEEVLYRESLAMGLDRDDTIVRRRLAQKLEFLLEDLSEVGSPAESLLAAYFSDHAGRYQTPSRVSFIHVYFSTAKRGQRAVEDAKHDLARLRNGATVKTIEEMGDVFLLDYAYKEVTFEDVEKVFGKAFAVQLVKLPEHEWQGPIASGYGMHLVKISERLTSQASTLDAVREQVKRDWLEGERRKIKEATFKKLRERYEVVIDEKAVHERAIAQIDASGAPGQ